MKKVNSKQITLVLTEQCNLNCVYCYENNKSTKKMEFETAQRILQHELTDHHKYDLVLLDLFGGEPFLNFDLMRSIVEYVDLLNIPNIKYKTTTNGTLIHGDKQKWLIANREKFQIGLSLDGKKETHNLNRSNSFDKIDLKFFLTYFPDSPIKMTISPQRLKHLFEDVVYCHDLGFKVNCNLAVGQNWGKDDSIRELEEQLMLLADYYLNHHNISPCSLLNESIVQIGLELPKVTTKWCGVGTHMHTYDVDGNCYPCHYFLPNSIGKDRSVASKNISFNEKFNPQLLDKKCQNCLIREGCPTCYGSNYLLSGNPYLKNDIYCRQVKTIMRARAYFKAKQWRQGLLKCSNSTEEQLLLKAILKIQRLS